MYALDSEIDLKGIPVKSHFIKRWEDISSGKAVSLAGMNEKAQIKANRPGLFINTFETANEDVSLLWQLISAL